MMWEKPITLKGAFKKKGHWAKQNQPLHVNDVRIATQNKIVKGLWIYKKFKLISRPLIIQDICWWPLAHKKFSHHNFILLGHAPHRGMDYNIGSNVWKFTLLKLVSH